MLRDGVWMPERYRQVRVLNRTGKAEKLPDVWMEWRG